MSKRAKIAALKAYPAERGHLHDRPYQRAGFEKGYEQAEKDTIERVVKWLEERDLEFYYLQSDRDGYMEIKESELLADLKKAMEEE